MVVHDHDLAVGRVLRSGTRSPDDGILFPVVDDRFLVAGAGFLLDGIHFPVTDDRSAAMADVSPGPCKVVAR